MSEAIRHARSFLFVPATRLDRLDKAFATGADAVIVDLEDAVAPDSKAPARLALAERLPALHASLRQRLLVRINAVGTPWHEEDLALMALWSGQRLGAVMLPKSETAVALRAVVGRLGAPGQVLALVESLAGLDNVDALAREPGVLRLAFGHLDFQLDLGMRCMPEEPELNSVRLALVAASRRARLPAPIDGVATATGDGARLAADVSRARAFGFGGKLCIHPAQVEGVNTAFAPSDSELAWARRVVDAAAQQSGQAFSLEGKMVDLPVILSAKALLASPFARQVTVGT